MNRRKTTGFAPIFVSELKLRPPNIRANEATRIRKTGPLRERKTPGDGYQRQCARLKKGGRYESRFKTRAIRHRETRHDQGGFGDEERSFIPQELSECKDNAALRMTV
jgi:hypothetical protein